MKIGAVVRPMFRTDIALLLVYFLVIFTANSLPRKYFG